MPDPAASTVTLRPDRGVPLAVLASAPGKLILAGEHAVVHGRPALTAALDLRLAARFEGLAGTAGDGARVRLAVPALGLAAEPTWREIAGDAAAARERWRRWAEAPGGAPFAAVRGEDPAHLVKVALGESASFLGEPGGPPVSLTVTGELPVGAGFGSSAAAAVAIVAGWLAFRGREPDPAAVEAIALEVERRQHGLPSGVDGATVLHGGLRWAERDGDGRLATRPLPAGSPLLRRLAVFHTGAPAEPTGAVVAAVRDRLAADRRGVERIFDRIAEATLALRDLLAPPSAAHPAPGRSPDGSAAGGDDRLAPRPEDPAALGEVLSACHRALVELGVVPAPVADLVAAVEAAGGAAKISGAGSLAGPGAGSLLAYHPDPERLAALPALADVARLPVRLGGPGLEVKR
jgi:mevalonate kinase